MLTLFVAVRALPKGAKVEKQTLLHTGRPPPAEAQDDGDSDEEPSLVDASTEGESRVKNTSDREYI